LIEIGDAKIDHEGGGTGIEILRVCGKNGEDGGTILLAGVITPLKGVSPFSGINT
jgi:hypothetical protein